MINNDTDNNCPAILPSDIPEFLQGDNWFSEDTKSLYLDFAKPYKPPRWTLSHNGVPLAKLGDVHVITGKSGHGKTNLMSQFIACLLSGSFGNLHCELPDTPVVLYIDTEQSEDDTIAIKNRVCNLAGLDYTIVQPNFKVVRLREIEDTHKRWRQILKVIWEVKPKVVFLDGMLDIVEDYNDQKECQPIIRKCMKLVTHYDMSMWCVLHENPQTDKMVGTLGSILQRKVTEVISVRKHKYERDKYPDKPDIFFEVQQLKARGRDQDDWYFEVMNVEGWGVPRELNATSNMSPAEQKQLQLMLEANTMFKAYPWTNTGATYSELERHLRKSGLTSSRRISDMFSCARDNNIIYQNEKRKYFYNGLIRAIPDDETKDLPFDQPDNEDAPF